MARLFLALWPQPPVRARLALFRDGWTWPAGARPVPDERLHATLHFIGSFPRDGIDALGERLEAVPIVRMPLRADATELWRGGVAVLRLEPEPALVALHEDLGQVLAALGVPLDSRPFVPHVTLARKASGARRPDAPPAIAWPASGFSLVESISGAAAAYRVLRSYVIDPTS